jgi:MFS family permease
MASHEFLPVLISGSLIWGAVSLLDPRWALRRGKFETLPDTDGLASFRTCRHTAFLLALILALPFAGLAVDEWGIGWGIVGGSFLSAVSVALLGTELVGRRLGLLLTALVGLGIGTAWLASATTILLPVGIGPEKPGPALNIGFTVVALGGLVAPLLVRPLQLSGRAVAGLAALCLVPAFLAVVTPTEAWPPAQSVDLDRLLGDPILWISGAALVFYGLLASRIDGWITSRTAEQPVQAWIFWGPFLASRLLLVPILEGVGVAPFLEPWLAVALAIVAAVALGQLLGAGETGQPQRALIFVGLALGPILPTILAVVMERFPSEPGMALGMVLVGCFVGGEALDPVLRWLSRNMTGQNAWRLPLAATLGLATLLLALGLLQIPENTRLPKPPPLNRFPTWHLPRLPHFQLPPFRKPTPPAESPADGEPK